MLKLTLVLGLLLLAVSVQAGQLVVSSLPYTVNQSSHTASTWDTITVTGTKLTSTTDGIIFTPPAHHWLVLLDQDTIVFGTDSTYRPAVYTGAKGIFLGSGIGGSHDITIKGGYILHDPDNIEATDWSFVGNDTLNSYNLCIDAGYASYNVIIDSVKEARVRGYNSHVMTGGNKMILVRGSRFFNDCYAYSSRCDFLTTCVKITGQSSSLLTGEYHYRIIGSYLEDNAHCAVYATGTARSVAQSVVVQFDYDTVKVDSRNRRYTIASGTCASSTNAYGIQYTWGGPGSYIKNCVITSGSTYQGGRGIQLVQAIGTQANPIEIANNKIDCHEGINVEFGTLYYGAAVKIREHCTGVWVHDNAIVWTADTTQQIIGITGVPYQPKGEALMYQMGFDVGSAYLGPYYITIENNACSVKVLTNTPDPDYEVAAVSFESYWYNDPTVIYRNNKTYSPGDNYITGQYDGGGNYVPMTGDSCFRMAGSLLLHQFTFNISDYRGATGNSATDFYYGSGNLPTSVGHYFQGNPTASGTQDITLRRTLNINVKGGLNGRPVSGANVTVTNGVGTVVAAGVTDSVGAFNPTVNYLFFVRAGSDLNFNNFTFAASKAGDSHTNTPFTVNWNVYSDTIILAATSGDGVWPGGNDIVEYKKTASYGSGSDWTTGHFLSGPKRQIAYSNKVANTIYAFRNFTIGTPYSYYNIVKYVSGISGLVPTDSIPIPNTTDIYNENCIAMTTGDTLIVVVNNTSFSTAIPILRFNCNVSPIAFIDRQTISVPTASIAVPTALNNSGVMLELRSCASCSHTNDVLYAYSANGGTTWTTPTRIAAGWNRENRSGVEKWGPSNAVVVSVSALNQTTPEIRLWSWEGGTIWTSIPSPAMTYGGQTIYPSREFGFAVTADSVVHLALSDTAALAVNSRIMHLWYKLGVGIGAWNYEAFQSYSSHYGQAQAGQQKMGIHCAASSGGLRFIYGMPEGNGTDQGLYSKKLKSDGTWEQPVTLLSQPQDSVGFITAAAFAPSISGDRLVVGARVADTITTNWVGFTNTYSGRYYLIGLLGSGSTPGGEEPPIGASTLPVGLNMVFDSGLIFDNGVIIQ